MTAARTAASGVAPVRQLFGRLADGTNVDLVEIGDGAGLKARLITFGAALQSLTAPDRGGRFADIVLGHDDLIHYAANRMFVGGTIGRFANRIAGGAFKLDGRAHQIVQNDGANALHGGAKGFDHAMWRVAAHDARSVTFARLSPDGEEGFPGNVEARVTYAFDVDTELTIRFEATTDAPTIVNFTHHSYFNLSGADCRRGVLDHRVTIAADGFTPVDDKLIPSGEVVSVDGTPFDFREPTALGLRIRDASDLQLRRGRGYDHNYVLRGGKTREPRFAARLEDPVSGRVLELHTTEPGLQLYSGNFLDGTLIGKGGVIYRQADAFCIEPQLFPDAPNHPAFPSARLNPGETYRHVSVYRLTTAPLR